MFSPSTFQKIVLFDGNGGVGVQVKILSPLLHIDDVGSGVKGFAKSKNSALVKVVSMGSEKVNTTAADGDTPVAPSAGTVETMNGPSWAFETDAAEMAMATNPIRLSRASKKIE